MLTVLGFLHICFQPYFTHILNISLTNSSTLLTSWVVILRICIIQGLWLFSRFVQAYVQGPDSYADKYAVENSTEWLRGEKLCTTSGKFHLAWEVPMADVSYYVPSAAIHSFMMFMPFFVLHPKMIVQGAVLWLTGPALARARHHRPQGAGQHLVLLLHRADCRHAHGGAGQHGRRRGAEEGQGRRQDPVHLVRLAARARLEQTQVKNLARYAFATGSPSAHGSSTPGMHE